MFDRRIYHFWKNFIAKQHVILDQKRICLQQLNIVRFGKLGNGILVAIQFYWLFGIQ